MDTPSEHWNTIYSTRADPDLGWYESDVSQTLKFLDLIPGSEAATIFLPGAGTSALVDELLTRGHTLILNDISDEALNRLKARTGTGDNLIWCHHDIARPVPANLPPAGIWIDRAVLHFLLEETDIQGYFANLRSVTSPGGHVLLAEFSTSGALKCAGLTLHRYSVDEMSERLGSEFELVAQEEYTYINPYGDPRPYVYALYRKRSG